MTEKLSELADRILIDWLPDSLKDSLNGALAAGVGREKLLRLAAANVGTDSFTYLAIWAHLEKEGGGPLPEAFLPNLEPRPLAYEP